MGKIGGSAWSVAKQYATRGGGALTSAAAKAARWVGGKVGGLAGRAKDWVLEKKAKVTGCGCFVAGTTVWAATGMVPIEQVQVGDWVFAQDPANGTLELREVTNVMEIKNAGGLDVVLIHDDGKKETISTTDEHPFYIEAEGTTDACGPVNGTAGASTNGEWRRADSLHTGDTIRTLHGTAVIESILFGTARQSVYNFTVDGLHTYHVGPGGVLVHNCNGVEWFNIKDMTHLRGVTRDHGWTKVFGSTPPSDQQLRELVKNVYENGRHIDLGVNPGGLGFEKHLDINGSQVYIRGTLTDAKNQIEIITAYVQ